MRMVPGCVHPGRGPTREAGAAASGVICGAFLPLSAYTAHVVHTCTSVCLPIYFCRYTRVCISSVTLGDIILLSIRSGAQQ